MSIKVVTLVKNADLYPIVYTPATEGLSPKDKRIEALGKARKSRGRATKKAALVMMAEHAHDDGRESRPSMPVLARELGFENERQAQRIVHALVKEEWL